VNFAGDWRSTAVTGRRENEDDSRLGNLRAMAMLRGVPAAARPGHASSHALTYDEAVKTEMATRR
jgi:hypothetical protein